ncbi:hypothetical protein DPMN_055885 [Dreissena polymorpha]|uniref:Uncharacterized protein n=1 Tax=Dreissena polymorpha TaxID=45954 RepID=A0A9D4CSL7_DREPO|nr:hypothetical protein DPMN_055885 [Dreissena polymorpha]
MSFLRVGRVSKVHPEIRPFSVDSLTAGFTTVDQLEAFYMKQVWSCLSYGCHFPLFTCYIMKPVICNHQII